MTVPHDVEGLSPAAYYAWQLEDSDEFWRRMGGRPDLAGRDVLDLGCGHGALSVQLARAGARVLGVDLDAERVAFAREHAASAHPELADRLAFATADVGDLDRRFDAVVSKDTFEHVQDLPGVLAALAARLRPGGVVLAGFSPLYPSPWGDHGAAGLRVPWAHLVLGERGVVARARRRGREVATLADLGLNGWGIAEYRDAFARSPLEVVSLRTNRGDKRLLPVLGWVGRAVPPLARYCTVSVYVTLRRPGGS